MKKVLFIPDISIHAPTRGATAIARPSVVKMEYFNPRSYKRSDDIFNSFLLMFHIFQSTLLQEERQGEKNMVKNITNFNPRSYKRSDSKNAQYSLCISAIIIA